MKQDRKAAKEALKEGGTQQYSTTYSTSSLSSQSSPYDSNFPSTQHQLPQSATGKKKSPTKKTMSATSSFTTADGQRLFSGNVNLKQSLPLQQEQVDLSSDDDESDDEVHHFMVSVISIKIKELGWIICLQLQITFEFIILI